MGEKCLITVGELGSNFGWGELSVSNGYALGMSCCEVAVLSGCRFGVEGVTVLDFVWISSSLWR